MTRPSRPGAYTPPTVPREPIDEHRCSRCYGPYGKSAIPCPNEPRGPRR